MNFRYIKADNWRFCQLMQLIWISDVKLLLLRLGSIFFYVDDDTFKEALESKKNDENDMWNVVNEGY